MHLSKYTKVYNHSSCNDKAILYSTKNGMTSIISKRILKEINEGKINGKEKEKLSKLGYIVKKNEKEIIDGNSILNKINNKYRSMNITIVLNLACNLSCVYCYEEGIKGEYFMSHEIADKIIEFIKNRFTKDKNSIVVDFFGGEPLLSINKIKYISNAIKPFVEKRNAKYSFTLITNGTLFNRKIALELKEIGLESIKITLDGPKEIHDTYRPYKNGKGSFQDIINNIKNTHDLVRIGIGGNYDKESYKTFPVLLKSLKENEINGQHISSIKFSPIMANINKGNSSSKIHTGCTTINQEWIYEAEKYLRGKILENGFSVQKVHSMPCIIDIDDTFVIKYDGSIYKCPCFIGYEEYKIGNICDGISDYKEKYKVRKYINIKCNECEYLIICYGGCRYYSLINNNNIEQVECKKKYYNKILGEIVRQDIDNRVMAK